MGLIVRCCPSLGNQGLQFLLFFRGQFDTVLLSRHDPSPWIQFANAGVVQLVDVHLFSSGSGGVNGEVSSIVLWWSFSVKRPAVRMVVVRSQAEVNPPVTQQIGGVDLIGSGAGGTGQLYYRGCPGVRDGVDTPSSNPTATCPPVGWSNG